MLNSSLPLLVRIIVATLLGLTSIKNVTQRSGNVYVKVNEGHLLGYILKSRGGRYYEAYSGIPYGRPPVGELRFKDPLPAEPWDGIREARTNVKCLEYMYLSPLPMTRIVSGQEDCLTVSVYTPNKSNLAKMPVMFYIHGGGWEMRNPPLSWFGPTFFMDHDIVVVHVTYRLSIMGFLSFEDDEQPGNMGLKDQNLALQWVYKNIEQFGGDPTRITVAGESAGAASAHYHAIMPKSRDMLAGAIMQSGSAYGVMGLDSPGEARKKALMLAKLTNCEKKKSRSMVKCLQKIDGTALMELTSFYRLKWDRHPHCLFRPVVERPGPNAFITSLPPFWPKLSVPFIVGIDEDDGSLASMTMLYPFYDFDFVNNNLKDLIPYSVGYNARNTADPVGVTNKIIEFYFHNYPNLTVKDEKAFRDLWSDSFFRYPMFQTVKNSVSDAYVYFNTYTSNMVFTIPGQTFHVQECMWLWDYEGLSFEMIGRDLEFSKDLVGMWANFVIYGNPNGHADFVVRLGKTPTEKPEWKKISRPIDGTILDGYLLNFEGYKMVRGRYRKEIDFWRNLGFQNKLALTLYILLVPMWQVEKQWCQVNNYL